MNSSKKVSRKEEKNLDLYQFFLVFGFNQSVGQMSHLLGIGRKTFYNRYGSREQAIMMTLKYAHRHFVLGFDQKVSACNHAVEELMLFIWDFMQFSKTHHHYFLYDMQHHLFLSEEVPFKSMLDAIVRKGLRTYQMREELETELFYPFFFDNLSAMMLSDKQNPAVLRYLLMPLLNERGFELLDELNFSL